MKRSSSMDCSSIGQSLKRVKISVSPGELRLDRDMECLASGEGGWTSASAAAAPTTTGAAAVRANPRSHRDHGRRAAAGRGSPPLRRVHGELVRPDARLVRDPVDPLRLKLTVLHRPRQPQQQQQQQQQQHPAPYPHHPHHPTWPSSSSPSASSSPLPPEQWTFVVQVPRMYPHAAPVVTRATRESVPNDDENVARLGSFGRSGGGGGGGAAAIAASSSALRCHSADPPVPERISIRPLPPAPAPHLSLVGDNGGDPRRTERTPTPDIDAATATYDAWSPVSTLRDLVDFLADLPARRRAWWSAEDNRRRHWERERLVRGGLPPEGMRPAGRPTIAPGFHGVPQQHTTQQEEEEQRPHHPGFQPWHHPKPPQPFQTLQHPNHRPRPPQPCHSLPKPQPQHHLWWGEASDDDAAMEDAGATSPDRRAANPFATSRFDVGYERGRARWGWGVR